MPSAVDLSLFSDYLKNNQPVLTPGKRLAREIAASWAAIASGQGVAQKPVVEPVDAWLEAVWRNWVEEGRLAPRRLLTRHQELMLWRQVIRADADGRQTFRLTHPKTAAVRARASWEKLLAHEGLGIKDCWSYFEDEEDCAVFAQWAKQFERLLIDKSVVTRFQAYQELLSVEPECRRPVALFGFPAPPPLTLKALKHLADVSLIDPANKASDGALETRAYRSSEEELAAAAKWAFEVYQRGAGRAAIVLMELEKDRPLLEYYLREQFDCLDAAYNDLPVNFSTGMALSATPMYRDALLALEWESRSLPRTEWLALMRSPYLPGQLSGSENLGVVIAQFASGSATVEMADAMHICSRECPDAPITEVLRLLRADRAHIGVKSLQDWAEIIRGKLLTWRWPYRGDLDSIEFQQLERFEASLDTLAQLAVTLPHQRYEHAVALWRSALDEQMFQPKTAYGSLQVLGPLETLGLTFDQLWIAGARRGAFPRTPVIDAFLPIRLQRLLDLADIDQTRIEREARDMLGLWRASAMHVTASFAAFQQGLPQRVSALLPEPETISDVDHFPPARWTSAAEIEHYGDDAPVPIHDLGLAGGSALIRDHAACPFRAFVRHRLKPAQSQAPVFGISSLERGTLIHDVMFYIWKQLGDHESLTALTADQEQSMVDVAVSEGMSSLESRGARKGFSIRQRVGEACWSLERSYVVTITRQWLALEKTRTRSYKIAALEQESTLALGELTLSLRPDRVDALEGGERLLIDYKTSAPARSKWLGDRPEEPQLPLYTLMDPEIKSIAFASLSDDMQFVSLGSGHGLNQSSEQPMEKQTRGEVSNWEDMTAHWRTTLTAIADSIAMGTASVDPSPRACDYCDLHSVCRIGQRAHPTAVTEGVAE